MRDYLRSRRPLFVHRRGLLFRLWLLRFWLRLDTPGREQVPGGTEIGALDLFEPLLTDGFVILAHAAPFLDKWAKRLEHTHPIFSIRIPFRSSRSLLQAITPCLSLLYPIMI